MQLTPYCNMHMERRYTYCDLRIFENDTASRSSPPSITELWLLTLYSIWLTTICCCLFRESPMRYSTLSNNERVMWEGPRAHSNTASPCCPCLHTLMRARMNCMYCRYGDSCCNLFVPPCFNGPCACCCGGRTEDHLTSHLK